MSFYRDTQPKQAYNVITRIDVPELEELVNTLLTQWGIVFQAGSDNDLQIDFESDSHEMVLRLQEKESERIPVPLNLESLWLCLQRHLFDPPREHYRIPLRVRGTLHHVQQREDFLSLSLSDAGLRFEFPRELIRNESVRIELPLGAEKLDIEGKVIYCVPTRSSNRMIIGVVFDHHQGEIREILRSYLVEKTLLQTRNKLEAARFEKALEYLSLHDLSRNRLLR